MVSHAPLDRTRRRDCSPRDGIRMEVRFLAVLMIAAPTTLTTSSWDPDECFLGWQQCVAAVANFAEGLCHTHEMVAAGMKVDRRHSPYFVPGFDA